MSVRCKNGGPAPCIDDMCHNGETTLCGIPFEEWSDLFADDEPWDDYADGGTHEVLGPISGENGETT